MGEWTALAACRTADTELFFSGHNGERQRAYAVCSTCTVRERCLQEALRVPAEEDYGIRGGMSARKRRLLRREQRRAEYVPIPIVWDPTTGRYRQA